MKQRSTEDIAVHFDFGKFPEPVVLAEGQAVWQIAKRNFVGTGSIIVIAQPTPSVLISCRFEGLSDVDRILLTLGGENDDQTLSLNSQDIPGFQLTLESDETAVVLQWAPKTLPIRIEHSEAQPVVRTAFHLFSFHQLHRLQRQRLTFADNDWIVELHQLPDIAETKKKSARDGVCRFTHVGELKKKDGLSFSRETAEEQLQLFRYFMALVRGTWCDPICSVGFDADGARAWENYAAPKTASDAISSWFDYLHPEQMSTLFPLFSTKWKSSTEWRSCLREVIYWYLNANTAGGIPGIDVSILLSQAALERLAFQQAASSSPLSELKRFKASPASAKIRSLLASVQIPTEIPTSLQRMQEIASIKVWDDGPHALTAIRNALVHPEPNDREKTFRAIDDAWKLGLWYLELSLLGVCGYNSSYGNRLDRTTYGQVSAVPWHTKRGT